MKEIIGTFYLIILFCIFFIDRIILMPLFWINSLKFKEWLSKDEMHRFNIINIINSFYRVVFIGIVYTIYKLIF